MQSVTSFPATIDESSTQKRLTKTFQGAGLAFLGEISWNGLGYTSLIILGHVFGPIGVGIFSLAIIIITIGAMISNLGLDSLALRYLSHYKTLGNERASKGIAIFAPLVSVIISTGIAICLSFLSKKFAILFFKGSLFTSTSLLIIWTLPFYSLCLVFGKGLQGVQVIHYKILAEKIIQPSILFLWTVLTLCLSKPLNFLFFGLLVSYIIEAILMFAFFYKHILAPMVGEGEDFHIGEWVKYSIPVCINAVGIYMISWTSTLFLGYWASPAETGIYWTANKLIYLVCLPPIAIEALFVSNISGLYAIKNIDELGSIYKTVTRWVYIFSVGFAGLLIVFRNPILKIFGSDFAGASEVLIFLCVAQLVFSANAHFAGNILIQTGYSSKDIFCVLITLAAQTIASIIFIPTLGVWGAAISFCINQVVFTLTRLFFVNRNIKILPFSKWLIKPVTIVLILVILSTFVPIDDNFPVFESALGISFFCILYFIGLFVWGFDKTDITTARETITGFQRKQKRPLILKW